MTIYTLNSKRIYFHGPFLAWLPSPTMKSEIMLFTGCVSVITSDAVFTAHLGMRLPRHPEGSLSLKTLFSIFEALFLLLLYFILSGFSFLSFQSSSQRDVGICMVLPRLLHFLSYVQSDPLARHSEDIP